jgi:hypothetical protein
LIDAIVAMGVTLVGAGLITRDANGGLSGHYIKLVEIHAAPAWLWPALVAAMLPSTRTDWCEVLVDPAQKSNELENCAPTGEPTARLPGAHGISRATSCHGSAWTRSETRTARR